MRVLFNAFLLLAVLSEVMAGVFCLDGDIQHATFYSVQAIMFVLSADACRKAKE